jgi:hypothetical protein
MVADFEPLNETNFQCGRSISAAAPPSAAGPAWVGMLAHKSEAEKRRGLLISAVATAVDTALRCAAGQLYKQTRRCHKAVTPIYERRCD